MTLFVWPPVTISGAATEATALLIEGHVSTIDTSTADIKTAVQLIDDTVLTNSHTSQKEIAVIHKGHVCTANSSSTPLAGGATFAGAYQDILDYNSVTVSVLSSHNSATNGLVITWSADGLTAMDTDVFTVLANQPKTFTFGGYARYFKVSFTNGATLQTTFILQSIVRTDYGKHSSHRIKDSIVSDDDATLTKAVLTALNPGGSFVNIDCTTSGNLKTSVEEFDAAVFGQDTMANSLPVTIASDQTAIPISNSDLSTIAGDTTSLDSKIPSQGQALMAASLPVTIASNQSAVPTLQSSALIPVAHDYIGVNLSGATTDVYTYKTGGSGGTTVATLTITYADSTKAVISNIART